MANRFNYEEYRPSHNGYVGGTYDLSPAHQQEIEWMNRRRGEGNGESTGGVRVPRIPSPIRPSGGMSLPIPTKVGLW